MAHSDLIMDTIIGPILVLVFESLGFSLSTKRMGNIAGKIFNSWVKWDWMLSDSPSPGLEYYLVSRLV